MGARESAAEDPPCAFLEDLEGRGTIEARPLEDCKQPKYDLMGTHILRKKALKVTFHSQTLLLERTANKWMSARGRDLGVSTRA